MLRQLTITFYAAAASQLEQDGHSFNDLASLNASIVDVIRESRRFISEDDRIFNEFSLATHGREIFPDGQNRSRTIRIELTTGCASAFPSHPPDLKRMLADTIEAKLNLPYSSVIILEAPTVEI